MSAIQKHPKGLMVLFFSEMWERFCYYGMRALLVLYLIDSLLKGDAQAFAIYGAYTALVYAAPVLGGKLADNLLGYRNAVIIGGIIMAIGEFMILGGTEQWLLFGMSAIVVGNGYFKANISSIVGKLYEDGDPRRDSGFTIFYIGINIGALLATTVCAEVGKAYGAPYGFALAGIGMLIGVIIFVGGRKNFEEKALPPDPAKLNDPWIGPFSRFHITLLGSIAVIPAIYYLIKFNGLVGWLLGLATIYVVFTLLRAGIKEGKEVRDRMISMIILFVFNIAFWACFEQAGSSLTLFARRNVNRFIGGWEMGAATTQFFNPFYILIFGSIFSIIWIKLSKIGKNPNIPMKFGLGIIQLGLGYLIVIVGGLFLSPEYLVPLWTLVFLYLLHTTGELFISPIGLSMVTKLAPKYLTATAMGGWFLSFAYSNYLAAMIATATGFGGHNATAADQVNDVIPQTIFEQKLDIEKSMIKYNDAVYSIQQDAKRLDIIKNKDDIGNLPFELFEFSKEIETTFNNLVRTTTKIIYDTVNTNNMLFSEDYYKSIVTLVNETQNIANIVNELSYNQTDYNEIRTELGSGINEFEKSLSKIEILIESITSNESNEKLTGIKQSIEKSKAKLNVVASHISWDIYYKVYITIGLITIAIGLFVAIISKYLNKLMHGVE